MLPALLAWLSAFLFTEAVEVPIYTAALRRDGDERAAGAPLLVGAAIGFGASALTHPIVWFVIPRLMPDSYWSMVVVAEAFAVSAEAVYLHLFGLRRALLWSLFANATSAGLGLASRYTFGWP